MFKIKEIHIRIIGIPVLGYLLTYVFCDEPSPHAMDFVKTIIFCFVFWQGIYTIVSLLRKKYSSIEQTKKRVLSTIVYASIYLIVSDLIMRAVFDYFLPDFIFTIDNIWLHWSSNFLISGMVVLIYESFYFYHRWYNVNLEAEQLRTQQITSQLEVLKSQISPHFLFNSLNTLVTLISENQNLATEFTQKLSDVYRYILQHKDKELVKLSTELEFIKSYIFLLKMRFSDNLDVTFNIDEQFHNNYVAPLTLQMLVENAIKHNVISKTHPLHIEIYTENGQSLIVKNKLQKKKMVNGSTKTGLMNIQKRYEYLTNKSIDVITTNANFMVAIPLINVIEE